MAGFLCCHLKNKASQKRAPSRKKKHLTQVSVIFCAGPATELTLCPARLRGLPTGYGSGYSGWGGYGGGYGGSYSGYGGGSLETSSSAIGLQTTQIFGSLKWIQS